MKVDVVKFYFSVGDLDGRGTGRVLDLGFDVKQIKHIFHVDKSLLDHPIVGPKEVQRRVELYNVRAVEDKVSDAE